VDDKLHTGSNSHGNKVLLKFSQWNEDFG